MTPRHGPGQLLLVIAVGLIVAACSGASSSASPAVDGSASAPTAGPSAEPTSLPTVEATVPASLEPADTSNWVAFRDKIRPFTTSFTADVQSMTQQLIDGDKAAASATAQKLHQQVAEYLAWLDAHPAEPCYRASWDPLHDALEDALKGTKSYAGGDFDGGADDLMSAGSGMIEAGGTIMDSGDRCRS